MRQDTAETLMERIAPQWEKVKTHWGTLYRAQYDWYGEVVEGEYKTFPPKLKNGTSVKQNKTAEEFFKEKIIGECFLLPSEGKRSDVLAFVSKDHIRYSVA